MKERLIILFCNLFFFFHLLLHFAFSLWFSVIVVFSRIFLLRLIVLRAFFFLSLLNSSFIVVLLQQFAIPSSINCFVYVNNLIIYKMRMFERIIMHFIPYLNCILNQWFSQFIISTYIVRSEVDGVLGENSQFLLLMLLLYLTTIELNLFNQFAITSHCVFL